jgi:DNA helicase-2/ATP-dependent DNA helicase PcrA
VRFYDRAEVKDLLAYLRVLHNPEDDVSVLRVLNVPARGIGKTSEDRILNLASQHGEGVYGALRRIAADPALLGRAAGKRVAEFVVLIEALRAAHKGGAGLYDLASQTLDRSGYIASLREQDTAEAEARVENLGELLTSVANFEREAEEATLAAFLERVALETQADEHGSESKLTLMTVHAAKGLEFPVVYVTGLEEGLFPRVDQVYGADAEELEEERRLAYVAFTRAEEQLVLFHAASRMTFGRTETAMPSRFLGDLHGDDVQRSFGLAGHGGFSHSASGGYGASRGGYGGAARRAEASGAAPRAAAQAASVAVQHAARAAFAGGGARAPAAQAQGHPRAARRSASSARVQPPAAPRGSHDDHDPVSHAHGEDPHDDPYASFRSHRAKSSAASNESYLDTSEGVDLDPSEALRPGARVIHPKFGIGRVRTVDRQPARPGRHRVLRERTA